MQDGFSVLPARQYGDVLTPEHAAVGRVYPCCGDRSRRTGDLDGDRVAVPCRLTMRKYEPLTIYLRRRRNTDCELTFGEIERLIGALLRNGAAHPSWWTGSAKAGAHREAWTSVGFEAVPIDRQDRVCFRRIAR